MHRLIILNFLRKFHSMDFFIAWHVGEPLACGVAEWGIWASVALLFFGGFSPGFHYVCFSRYSAFVGIGLASGWTLPLTNIYLRLYFFFSFSPNSVVLQTHHDGSSPMPMLFVLCNFFFSFLLCRLCIHVLSRFRVCNVYLHYVLSFFCRRRSCYYWLRYGFPSYTPEWFLGRTAWCTIMFHALHWFVKSHSKFAVSHSMTIAKNFLNWILIRV